MTSTKHPGAHRVSGPGASLLSADTIELGPILAAPTAEPVPQLWGLAPVEEQALALAAPSFADSLSMDYVLQNLFAPNAAASGGSGLTDDNCDLAVNGDLARDLYGVTGAGIKIGILSDSFNLDGGMAAAIADGDLPANVQILEEGTSGHDEGMAMAELIHKIAPGAEIMFHTATNGEADFAQGITELQQAGCNVIVDDVAYLDEPFFQDGGAVQQAVENAVAAGVSYFTAASNEGENYVQQAFAPMQLDVPGLPGGVVVQNFGSAAAPQPWVNVNLPQGGVLELDMQWDQPFASIGGSAGTDDSIGMALYNSSGQMVAMTRSDVVGGNPVQIMSYTNPQAGSAFRLVVFANGGSSLPDTFKIINYGNGTINGDAGTGSGTVIGHEMLPGVNTVGAIAWSATPAFGGSGAVEPFSSVGSGTILLGPNGAPLANPINAQKVNFVAPDGSMTSIFAPFYGTSAAAPNAAAVAALMLQADPSLTPGEVTTLLEQSAIPVLGGETLGGAGLIQADTAVQLAMQYGQSHEAFIIRRGKGRPLGDRGASRRRAVARPRRPLTQPAPEFEGDLAHRPGRPGLMHEA